MMRASILGGMPAVYGKELNRHKKRSNKNPDYDPNPRGYYELGGAKEIRPGEKHDFDEYPYSLDGMLLKMHVRMLKNSMYPSRPATYKIVFMRRSFEEIEMSMHAFWGKLVPYLKHDVHESIKYIRTLPGVDLIEVNYVDVINDPMGQMQRLKDWGWPIDVKLAADVVDPALYRNRGQQND